MQDVRWNPGSPAYQRSHILSLGPEISKCSLFSPGSRCFASLPLACWFQAINSTNPCLCADLLLTTWRMAESKSWLWIYSSISRERSWFSFPAMCHVRPQQCYPFFFFSLPPGLPGLTLGSWSPGWTNNLDQICWGVKRKSTLRVKIIQESIFSAVLWSIEITLSLFPFFSAWEANCFDCGDMS